MDPAKVAVICKWLCPTKVHGVRSFVGLAYFRKFIEAFSKLVAPLTHLTKKDVPFTWDACQTAFLAVEHAFTNTPVLALPNLQLPTVVVGIGAVLLQEQKPLAYESRKLKQAEANYTTGEQELLAVVHALKIWRCYLEGPHSLWLPTTTPWYIYRPNLTSPADKSAGLSTYNGLTLTGYTSLVQAT